MAVQPPSRDYKVTLNLPQTSFPIRPQAAIDDPRIIAGWESSGVYRAAMALHAEGALGPFILHDGPPYANGHLHLGHAYNKILKDTIAKSYRMAGYHVPVIPGWDCHGLPIEWKVTKEYPGMDPLETKARCRTTARHWMAVQSEEFRRLGVIMDWEHPYYTMHPAYEAAIVRAFGIFVDQGFISRKNRTVAWCMHCATTLAAAEIEYHDRKDPSIYLRCALTPDSVQCLKACQDISALQRYAGIDIVVWTTTPWTLPLNRAIALKPGAAYALVPYHDRLLIVGASLVLKLAERLQCELPVVAVIPAEACAELSVKHPIEADRTIPCIFDDQISLEDGTACVHVAPGCGPSDYDLGVRYGLEIYSPVSPEGSYTDAIMPIELAGMPITEGQGWVIRTLAERGTLLHKGSLVHSYPHCWRCRQGLIFRATKQWFLELHHHRLQERTLQALDNDLIQFIPARSKNFLRATISGRLEWCLSRQRTWGVPIPALICMRCDAVEMSREQIAAVAEQIARVGIEYWDTVSVATLALDLRCRACGGQEWRKERDILDVWFDSGVSHFAVRAQCAQQPSYLDQFPADIYVEGTDQHRGWFQSSLLTSMVLAQQPPMRMILSHGFTVDEQGRKMSKSLGNGVEPQTLLDTLGTDGLRLWVASMGHEGDIVVSPVLLDNVAQVYRKIRNTCRFFLQNLFDFDITRHAVSLDHLLPIDRYALARFSVLNEQVAGFAADERGYYATYDLTAVFHSLSDYCTNDLSAIYCDILKDRLYVCAPGSHERRSAQTVLWYILDGMVRMIAPIMSCTAELIAEHYLHPWTGSVHLQRFADYTAFVAADDAPYWELLLAIRSALMKVLEEQRVQGVIKHSLQAAVVCAITPDFEGYDQYQAWIAHLRARGDSPSAVLQELLVVSTVELVDDRSSLRATPVSGIYGAVSHATGMKCPRCWQWRASTHDDGLCARCVAIIAKLP